MPVKGFTVDDLVLLLTKGINSKTIITRKVMTVLFDFFGSWYNETSDITFDLLEENSYLKQLKKDIEDGSFYEKMRKEDAK